MYLPVNLANIGNMNWSIVVIGAIILLPGIYWIAYARHVYIKEDFGLESDSNIVEGISRSPTNLPVETKH